MKTNRRDALRMVLEAAGGGVSALALKMLAARPMSDAPRVAVESRPWPNLIAHWKMDGDCQDAVGTHHGEGHNIKFVEGRDGKPQSAAQFNGVDSFIEVADHEELNLETRDFAVALWANLPEDIESAHGDILTKYD